MHTFHCAIDTRGDIKLVVAKVEAQVMTDTGLNREVQGAVRAEHGDLPLVFMWRDAKGRPKFRGQRPIQALLEKEPPSDSLEWRTFEHEPMA